MDCKKNQKLFTGYADGDLDVETAREFDDHLKRCSACHTEWDYFKKTIQYLKTIEHVSAPSDLLPGIHAKIERRGILGRLLGQWWRIDLSMSWQSAVATIAIAFAAMAVIKTFPVGHHQSAELSSKTFQADKMPSVTPSAAMFDYASNRAATSAFSRYQPSPSFYETYTNFTPDQQTARLISPDISISLQSISQERKKALYRQLIAENGWNSRTDEDELVIYLRPGQLRRLQHTFAQHRILFPVADTQTADINPHKKLLTVAIHM